MKNRTLLSDVLSPLGLFVLGYLLLIFPFAFFRHDDWIIMANGMVHLPRDWAFAFKPTLMMGGVEEVWFFRPFFKGIQFIFYQLFHLNYFLWLTATLLITVTGISAAAGALTRLRHDQHFGRIFTTLFVATVFYHFWSLVWAGEGLMNCPQLTLLAVNLYCIACAQHTRLENKRVLYLSAGVAVWVLSLGFKESGVFHVAFLAAMIMTEPAFRPYSFRRKAKWLAPYAIIAAGYLVYRLYFLPLNAGYVPKISSLFAPVPIAILAASLAAPFLSMVALEKNKIHGKKVLSAVASRWIYLPFFAVTVGPYLGHPFFSPGWLLLPGFYAAFFFALLIPKELATPTAARKMGTALLIVSLAVVGARMQQLGWWKWGKAQKQLLQIFSSLNPDVTQSISVLDCPNPDYPQSSLDRVVASSDSMYHMWEVLNKKPVRIHVVPCDARVPSSMNTSAVFLRWKFPGFEKLN